jgi:hypothetical protein
MCKTQHYVEYRGAFRKFPFFRYAVINRVLMNYWALTERFFSLFVTFFDIVCHYRRFSYLIVQYYDLKICTQGGVHSLSVGFPVRTVHGHIWGTWCFLCGVDLGYLGEKSSYFLGFMTERTGANQPFFEYGNTGSSRAKSNTES